MESTRRKNLAVWHKKEEFLEAFRANQTVIVVGDSQSGKTTQIPQFVLEEAFDDDDDGSKLGMIACALPRKLAAISASQRVVEEMGVNIGEEVGYSVPFEDCTSSKTVIKYLTDSMLVREAMYAEHRLLEQYRVIIVDGVHERSLATDILFGFLKQVVLKNRPELKLVVMGYAPILEADGKFENYFEGAPLVKLPPAMLHPVELFYMAAPQIKYFEAAVETVVQIHMSEPAGDILVFLTGEEQIEKACREIKREIENYNNNCQAQEQGVVGPCPADVLPLYSPATMLMHHQNDPERKRKIVVSTHTAAENLLTMIDDGIVYVLDIGLAKHRVYDPRLGLDSMLVTPITQASADWRLGCAGRTRPGKCFRLYTEKSFRNDLYYRTIPEILRSTNLVNTVLTLKKLGIEDLLHFDFIDLPNPETLMRALERLNHLGALDDRGNLTEVGEFMSESTAIINWLHLLALDQ